MIKENLHQKALNSAKHACISAGILFLLMSFPLLMRGQGSCGNSILLTGSTNSVVYISDSVYWFRFVADTGKYLIRISEASTVLKADIKDVFLFNGSCLNLNPLLSASKRDSLFIYAGRLIAGNNYYIRIRREVNGAGGFTFNLKNIQYLPVELDSCPVGPCDSVRNGSFEKFNFGSYDPDSPFCDDWRHICGWRAAFGSPQICYENVNSNWTHFAQMWAFIDTLNQNVGEGIYTNSTFYPGRTYHIRLKYKIQGRIADHVYICGTNFNFGFVRHINGGSGITPALLANYTQSVFKHLTNLPADNVWKVLEFDFQPSIQTDQLLIFPYKDHFAKDCHLPMPVMQTFLSIDSISYKMVVDAGPDKICTTSPVTIGSPAVGGMPPYTYLWSPSAGLSQNNIPTPVATPTVNITYTVTATDARGCTATDRVRIYFDNISINAGRDTIICPAYGVQIGNNATGNVPPFAYQWTPVTGLSSSTISRPVASPSVTTTYTVTASDVNGCTASDNVTVKVITFVPVITGNNNNCKRAVKYSIHNASAFPAGTLFTWTITGGTFAGGFTTITTNISNSSNVQVTWNATLTANGTISVRESYCGKTGTYTVYQCCRKLPTDKVLHDTVLTAGQTFRNVSSIYLDGQITIGSNVSFKKCNIYMGPHASVIVQDGRIFSVDSLSVMTAGCGVMWDSISVQSPNALVKIQNSTVKFGINAITSRNGGKYEIRGSTFNQNYKCLILNNSTSNTNPGIISKSTFTCSAMLMAPYANNRTKTGIEINNMENVIVGDSTTFANRNKFSRINNCIKINTSNVRIYNNRFELSDSANTYAILSNNTDTARYRVIQVGNRNLGNAKRSNIILNYPYGIDIKNNQDIYIINDTINSPVIDIGILNCPEKMIKIRKNNMSYSAGCKWMSVFITDIANAVVYIDSNRITDAALYGILVQNAMLSPVNRLQIAANYLKIKGNAAFTYTEGIHVTNINGNLTRQKTANITGNKVLMDYNTTTKGFKGITSVSSNFTLIQKDTIQPFSNNYPTYSAANAPNYSGIYGERGNTYYLCRNRMYRMGSGFNANRIVGRNSNLMLNTFDNGYYGVRADSAGLGDQGTSCTYDNKWVNFASNKRLQGVFSAFTFWAYRDTNSNPNPYIPSPYAITPPQSIGIDTVIAKCGECFRIDEPYTGKILINDYPINIDNLSSNSPGQRVRKYFEDYYNYFSMREIYKNRPDYFNLHPELAAYFGSMETGRFGQFGRFVDDVNSGNFGNARLCNRGLFNGDDFDQNLVTVNSIYLDTWAKQRYTYTHVEYSTLKSIADASPEQKGPAVYNARVMLMIIPGMTYRFMNGGDPDNENKPGDSTETLISLPYPNPATGNLSFTYSINSKSSGYICLYDITGRMVLNENLLPDKNMITLSTSELNHGIYLYAFIVNNIKVSKGRLIVIK